MIRSMAIIFGCLAAGEFLSAVSRVPVPGSVFGMLLLAGLLQGGLVKLEWVKPVSDVLLDNLAFLFVPPGVGLMLHFDLLSREWVSIAVALSTSTFIVLAVTGHVAQVIERKTRC